MMSNSELASFLAYAAVGTRFAEGALKAAEYLNKTTAEKFKFRLYIENDRHFDQWIESGTNSFSSMTTTINKYFYSKKSTDDWCISVSFFACKEHMAFCNFVFNFDKKYYNVSSNSCYENITVLHKLFGDNMFDSLKEAYLKEAFIEEINKKFFLPEEIYIEPNIKIDFENA